MKVKKSKKPSLVLIMIIYLFGVFMGAIDTGIVTPARTIIQNNLGVGEQVGIWMITIYTLAYAASIPIMGKLADKYGRKYIYLTSIFLFGLGSLFCGLSQNFGSFSLLLTARVIQAIGGGGIMPIATGEFGTSFPKEKRGMALGLVGGVYGIANIFGSSAGSAILDLFGADNWQFIFYINIPIAVFVIIIGFLILPNNKAIDTRKIDFFGIFTVVAMVLSLLYGLTNIDFFHLWDSVSSMEVFPYLLIFIILLPLYIYIEKKASDPVINLSYFTNKNIIITLLISFISGMVMMGMIFVPQFSENALKIASGSGGYFVMILGLFAGVGAPLSGRLIDKFGVKFILFLGFLVSIVGSLFLILVTTSFPNIVTVVASLILIGIGVGFTMGTPLNYMMLQNTDVKESNSALATLSLVRSIGTAIAPAIMVGFLAHAGGQVQTNVMSILPNEIAMPELPYATEISDTINQLKENPQMKERLASVDIPDLAAMQNIRLDFNQKSDYQMPEELVNLMKSADVTTITENSQILAENMFAEMTPGVINKISTGIGQGIDGIDSGINAINTALSKLEEGYDGITKGIAGMESAVKAQESTAQILTTSLTMLSQTENGKLPLGTSVADLIPPYVKVPEEVKAELEKITSVEALNQEIEKLNLGSKGLKQKIEESSKSAEDMSAAIYGMGATITQMNDLKMKMTELNNAIPSAFETAKTNYINEIGNKKEELQETFQNTLNQGFRSVYLTSAIAAVIALIFLLFYRPEKVEVTHEENN
jgi:EmrB/QacA subfamily drug resistance transporter